MLLSSITIFGGMAAQKDVLKHGDATLTRTEHHYAHAAVIGLDTVSSLCVHVIWYLLQLVTMLKFLDPRMIRFWILKSSDSGSPNDQILDSEILRLWILR